MSAGHVIRDFAGFCRMIGRIGLSICGGSDEGLTLVSCPPVGSRPARRSQPPAKRTQEPCRSRAAEERHEFANPPRGDRHDGHGRAQVIISDVKQWVEADFVWCRFELGFAESR
jgi:hypothetical protein